MTAFSVLLLGFLLGLKHATEADHLAAVATLATRQSSVGQTVRQGVAWGVGHTLTLVTIGTVVLLFGKAIPSNVAQFLELAVGVMLVLLGADVLRRLLRARVHFHVHSHDGGIRHMHAHRHAHASAVGLLHRGQSRHEHVHPQRLPLRALAIGIMHGMAGSAALILLSLEAVQSLPMGVLYMLVFGSGSIVGMALLSVAIAIPLRVSTGGMERVHRGLTVLVGAFSVGLGLYMVYEIGIAGGLFAA